ncbi:hypothetical protein M406DRAFT_326078 [Cryphonectria parasitica EP155]|uniref:DUF6590 domain-containing protein n=1 Tax=Cryphonectria parasitica (strain ATCC 38755 / EP155) TaxID=660469 RepID=A0A9P4YC67_CRYP1|nr:uncharacterized protein M406DRAFT_326078 [Cryphonectria parasitica EP155]KAF3770653.1 hypothetical protein M406DRAFT_326078 [Cryphonectria parasitica EP155]
MSSSTDEIHWDGKGAYWDDKEKRYYWLGYKIQHSQYFDQKGLPSLCPPVPPSLIPRTSNPSDQVSVSAGLAGDSDQQTDYWGSSSNYMYGGGQTHESPRLTFQILKAGSSSAPAWNDPSGGYWQGNDPQAYQSSYNTGPTSGYQEGLDPAPAGLPVHPAPSHARTDKKSQWSPNGQSGYQGQGGAFFGVNSSQGQNSSGGLPPVELRSNATKGAPNIRRNKNGKEYLDSTFQPGKIIKVMWAEPKGMAPTGQAGSFLTCVDTLLADHQNAFWRGFRRFIIINNREGHCTCVPIYSYGGQGCIKNGAKAKQHGIIYESPPGNGPTLLPGEPMPGFAPIRAITTAPNNQPLNDASRVNYAKVVTIEHNVKVMFLGEVVEEDWEIAKNAVKSFFD